MKLDRYSQMKMEQLQEIKNIINNSQMNKIEIKTLEYVVLNNFGMGEVSLRKILDKLEHTKFIKIKDGFIIKPKTEAKENGEPKKSK